MTTHQKHGNQSQSSTPKTITIPEKLSNYIESLQYEVLARQDLLSFLVRNNLKNTEAFEEYHKEYIEFYTQYQLAKNELEKDYVLPLVDNLSDWRLNFDTCEVIIYEK